LLLTALAGAIYGKLSATTNSSSKKLFHEQNILMV
jgi:hypothetical protein